MTPAVDDNVGNESNTGTAESNEESANHKLVHSAHIGARKRESISAQSDGNTNLDSRAQPKTEYNETSSHSQS